MNSKYDSLSFFGGDLFVAHEAASNKQPAIANAHGVRRFIILTHVKFSALKGHPDLAQGNALRLECARIKALKGRPASSIH